MHDQRREVDEGDADLATIPGDWPRIYVAVLFYLAVVIAGLYAVSRVFAY